MRTYPGGSFQPFPYDLSPRPLRRAKRVRRALPSHGLVKISFDIETRVEDANAVGIRYSDLEAQRVCERKAWFTKRSWGDR